MQERNLKVIEGLLFVLFILLWGLFLSGGSGKVKRKTLSLWQYLPVHTEVFHDFFENSIRKGQYELTPILGYDTYEGGKARVRKYVISTLPLTTSRLKSSSTTCVYSTVKRS